MSLSKSGLFELNTARESMTYMRASTRRRFSSIMRMAFVICPGNHWMFIVCLRPDEKCCCAPFLPGSVPCAPCAMRTHRTASQQSLVRRTCRRTSGICRRGLPLHPVFVSPAKRKMLLRTIFAGLRSLCSVRNAHSPHCVTAVACPPHMSPYKRDLPQGSPLHPVFVSPARRKMLFTTFLPGSVPCAPCAMRTHRTASQNIFLCYVRRAYLSSRSGRRSLVISNAFFARQASTSWWLPETSTSGTDSPLYTCGRV